MHFNNNLFYDKWLSKIIGKKSYSLSLDENFFTDLNKNKNLWEKSIESIKASNKRSLFIYTKVSTEKIHHIKTIEKLGFFLVDTNVKLIKDIGKQDYQDITSSVDKYDVRFANSNDKNETVLIGGNTFIYSRFHLDPHFSINEANIIKTHWVSNYFDGKRGDQMIVGLSDNKIISFLQIIKPCKDYFIIDLIGVDEKFRRRGISEKMINYAIRENNGINKVIVGTQIGNMPSIRLYQKMDFFLESSKYVFHLHRD